MKNGGEPESLPVAAGCHSHEAKGVSRVLLRLAALLLTAPLAGEGLLGATLVARLQVERVFLDVLDDIFLLHLALEASQGAFDRFTFLHLDFGHVDSPP